MKDGWIINEGSPPIIYWDYYVNGQLYIYFIVKNGEGAISTPRGIKAIQVTLGTVEEMQQQAENLYVIAQLEN